MLAKTSDTKRQTPESPLYNLSTPTHRHHFPSRNHGPPKSFPSEHNRYTESAPVRHREDHCPLAVLLAPLRGNSATGSAVPSVPLHVEGQVVGPAERALAQVAAERLLARVLPVVPGQLVGSCELPRAAVPGTLVGFFTWNSGFFTGLWRR